MGGRGSKLNVEIYLNKKLEKRIEEFETIAEDGNLKFLVQKQSGPVTAPIFSNTSNRIYVTLKRDGKIASITQYDSNHETLFSIHEPHSGETNSVHEHGSFRNNRKITYWNNMSIDHQNLYKTIKRKYVEFDILNKVKEWNRYHG